MSTMTTMTEQDFTVWLGREMPAGTVIGDPAWWAPRILRAATATIQPVAAPEPVNTVASLEAATGSMEDFAEAADLVGVVAKATTNGEALGAILKYRHKIRKQVLAAAPAQAEPDEVRENLALVIARLEQIKHIADDNFDVRTFAKEALVCANALRTTTQAATPADSQKGEGDE